MQCKNCDDLDSKFIFLICREVDLFNGAHQLEEYKAINPISTVPALDDNDFKVFDSSAIAIYLVEKYAKDDSLYPKDLRKRTKVNEVLFYVGNYIFPRVFQLFVAGYFEAETEVPQKRIDELLRGYRAIESFLEGNDYLTGSTLTLPDLYLWANIESLGQVVPVDTEQFPNFTRWWKKMREHPSVEMNKTAADEHVAFYRKCVEDAIAKSK